MNNDITISFVELTLHISTIVLIFVSFLFAFFLLTVPTKNKTANVLLAIYLFVGGVDVSAYFYNKYFDVPGIVDMLRHDIAGFIDTPLLFLFVLSIIYSNFKLKPKHLLHLLPLVVNTVFLFPRFYLPIINGDETSYQFHLEGTFTYILATIQRLVYIIATFVILYRYRKLLMENYSTTNKSNYGWLFQMNVFGAVLFLMICFKNVYKFNSDNEFLIEIRLLALFMSIAFICWLVLKALYAPKMFRGIDSNLSLASDLILEEEPKKTDAPNPELAETIARLDKHMKHKEPFLNPTLTIKELAAEMEMNVPELSVVINHHLHQNFYEYVNGYRIEKAKDMFRNPNNNKLTILEILYHVGFNSKSSFNTFFKKHTGLTPTSYRTSFHKK